MSKTTLGIIAGVIGTALAAMWWKRRRPAEAVQRPVEPSMSGLRSRDLRHDLREEIDLTGYAPLAEGII
jgi:hypothetical protein